jgi:transposase-like protein
MKLPYDAAVRDAVRLRMSPPNRESVTEIARDTGITTQTLYNWRIQWQKQGQLVPATTRPPEQWSAADKLAAVIQAAGLSGTDLGAFCRERGLYPKQLARWRQAAEDANGPTAPSMADQRELQRKNQELIRQNRKLERELQKKEKALAEAAVLLMLAKKRDALWPQDEET